MPFGAASVVGQAFGLGLRNALKIAGLFAVFMIAAVLVYTLCLIPDGAGAAGEDPSPLAFIGVMLSNLLGLSAVLAASTVTTSSCAGNPASFFGAAAQGLRQTPIGALVHIAVSAAMGLALALPLLGIVALSDSAAVLVPLALAVPIALWVGAIFTPLLPILVAEEAGLGSLRRSVALTRGYRMPIAGASLLLALAVFAMAAIAGLLVMLAIGAAANGSASVGALALAVSGLIHGITSVVVLSISLAFQSAVYGRLLELE